MTSIQIGHSQLIFAVTIVVLTLDEIFIMLFTYTQKSISIFFILGHFLVALKIYIPLYPLLPERVVEQNLLAKRKPSFAPLPFRAKVDGL